MQSSLSDVRDLCIEQAALLWCMRLWVAGRLGAGHSTARIERMAVQLDAGGAGPFMEGFMAAINGGAQRPVQVGCMGCTKVGADEQLLLDTLGLVQERRLFEALRGLAPLVGREAASAAVGQAERAVLILARAGRFLPAPDEEAGFALAAWLLQEVAPENPA